MAGSDPITQQESAAVDSPAEPARPAPGIFSGPLGIALFLLLFGTAIFLSYRTLTAPAPVEPQPLEKDFLCLETKKPFVHAMQVGEKLLDEKGVYHPILSPHSNRNTGYPAEKCYWTRDGKRKLEPTYVILNDFLGRKDDTICPDCGRIVIGHNPTPPESVPLAN